MKVSVIMCAYNEEVLIREAIESIQNQTYTNWELVIADDCSPDNTASVVTEYAAKDSRIKLHVQEENLGYIRNKNKAFSYATGDLLTQLDSDDTCPPDRLEKQVNVFIEHPEINICGTNYRTIDMQGRTLEVQEYTSDRLIHFNNPEYSFWFPSLMFRKEVMKKSGLFSEYFIGTYGDDHYWTFLVNQKHPIYFLKEPLYNYRCNVRSITNVMDNPRKLIVSNIVDELYRQRKETGTDFLEQGEEDKMREFEESVLNNKVIMSEKYRLWAAKAVDNGNWQQAKTLLKKSLLLNKTNKDALRTYLYYFRSRFTKA